jgi:hypothetical protein
MSRKLPLTIYYTMGCEIVVFSGDVNVFLVPERLKPIWHGAVGIWCIDFVAIMAS